MIKPFSFPPSQTFEGNDGHWSTFTLQIGQPAQDVRVLPFTTTSEVFVVPPEGCPDGLPLPPPSSGCQDSRGLTFTSNQSTSWQGRGLFELGSEEYLGQDTTGQYGFDSVALGWQGSGGPSEIHQMVANLDDATYWLGAFGLNPAPTNFSSFNDPQTSFLQSLRNDQKIPSVTWGYSAGAWYRSGHVPASLTLGGYDSALFDESESLRIPMTGEGSTDLMAGVQRIQTNQTGGSLLPGGPINVYIDSATPFIWLPVDACEAFEKAFNLTWNPTWELYLVDNSTHDSLMGTSPHVSFSLSVSEDNNNKTTDVQIPYDAFDLVASYPLLNSTLPPGRNYSRYFPLRRAANESQYVLGRTFLQEAYLLADYENGTFSVSQRLWNGQSTGDSVKGLASLQDREAEQSKNKNSVSGGAIAGIVVGVVIFIVLLAVAVFFIRKNRLKTKSQQTPPPQPMDFGDDRKDDLSSGGTSPSRENPFQSMELMPESDSRERHEIGHGREILELGAESRAEMPGSKGASWHEAESSQRAAKKVTRAPQPPVEMDATQVFELPTSETNEKR